MFETCSSVHEEQDASTGIAILFSNGFGLRLHLEVTPSSNIIRASSFKFFAFFDCHMCRDTAAILNVSHVMNTCGTGPTKVSICQYLVSLSWVLFWCTGFFYGRVARWDNATGRPENCCEGACEV
jgi:hypothetical protein